MRFRVLDSALTESYLGKLVAQFGAAELGERVLLQSGIKRIRMTTLKTLEVASRMRGVQSLGIYVAKLVGNDLVLSTEGVQMLCKSANKNIELVDRERATDLLAGGMVTTNQKAMTRFGIASLDGHHLGISRVSNGKMILYIAKWRRIT